MSVPLDRYSSSLLKPVPGEKGKVDASQVIFCCLIQIFMPMTHPEQPRIVVGSVKFVGSRVVSLEKLRINSINHTI